VTPAVDADRSWALFPHGLLVFERAEPGGSHLLVSKVDVCTAPACDCRDIGLRAIALDVDDGFDPTHLSSDALLARFATEAMEARLDIDTGNVAPDDYEGRVPLSAEWVQYVQAHVDGELLDVLHEKWLRSKGTKSVPKTEWEPRDPGDLVGWYEAHPSDRSDIYLVDDHGAFIAEDLFCVKPACTCDEAVIAFAPAEVASAQDVGSIRLRISTLEVVERRVEASDAALLDRLWLAFSARHRHLTARLLERNKQMVELASGRGRSAPARSTPRAGRNELCPCGSGKKYKRCCG
jgi:SEC-C motif